DPAPPHCPELSLAQAGDVTPLEEDAAPRDPAGPPEIADDGKGHRRLAAAGFADQSHRLPRAEGEAQAGDDVHLTGSGEVRDARAVQDDNRRVSHGARSREG